MSDELLFRIFCWIIFPMMAATLCLEFYMILLIVIRLMSGHSA